MRCFQNYLGGLSCHHQDMMCVYIFMRSCPCFIRTEPSLLIASLWFVSRVWAESKGLIRPKTPLTAGSLVWCLRNSFTTIDLVNDLLSSGGPDKGLRLFVGLRKILFDSGNEFFKASEVAPSQALLGEFGKPTLHQVKPGRTGWSVMNMKALMFRQPLRNIVMLMGAVIVHN